MAEARALYAEAWTAFRREMELAPRGKDPKGALAATLRLRQKSSLIRAGRHRRIRACVHAPVRNLWLTRQRT